MFLISCVGSIVVLVTAC
uniref:Uncharacterized protein n=1 Tax=Arundo donax TaxID=35708 RepID=A0A0A9HNP3_ARUDO